MEAEDKNSLLVLTFMKPIDYFLYSDCGILGSDGIQILWRGTKGNVWLRRTPIWVLYYGWYANYWLPYELPIIYKCVCIHVLWVRLSKIVLVCTHTRWSSVGRSWNYSCTSSFCSIANSLFFKLLFSLNIIS